MDIVRRAVALLVFVVALVAAAILGSVALRRIDERPRTDDAFIYADIVHLAPEVSGRIVELPIANNQLVEKGDVLFIIDREPFAYRVEEAKAKIASLEAQLANQTTEVAAAVTRAEMARTEIASSRATLALASKTRARLEPLQKPGYVSAEDLDKAKTSEKNARTSLEHALQQATEAQQSIVSTKATEAEIASAKVSLQSAERDLRLTTVLAPCRGRVTALSVAAGEYATTGKAVFTLIDTRHWWAVGNFKETDLSRLAEGDAAQVYIMSDPSEPLHGTLSDLGFGVSPQEDSPAGGLPDVPRSLNWVRIAQRFPVRILLDGPPPKLMRVGASAVIIIASRERHRGS